MQLLKDYPRFDKPEPRPASKLATALFPWGTTVSTIVLGAITAKVLPSQAFWVVLVTFVVLILLHVFPWLVTFKEGLERRRRERRIQRLYQEPILALLNAAQPLVADNHTVSLSYVFNPILERKLLEAGVIPSSQVTVHSLKTQLRNLKRRAPSMGVAELLQDLHEFLQLWIQLVNVLGYQLKEILKDPIKEAESEGVLKSWKEMSRKAVSIFHEYQRLVGVIRVIDPDTPLPDYLGELVSLE